MAVLALAALPIALLAVAAMVWAGSVGALIVLIAFVASRARPFATRWIDRLEALAGR